MADSKATAAFVVGMGRLLVRMVKAGLSPAEIDRCMEPYRSFLALMRDNDVQDTAAPPCGGPGEGEG